MKYDRLISFWLMTNVVIASYISLVFALWLLARREPCPKREVIALPQPTLKRQDNERGGEAAWPPVSTMKRGASA